MIILEFKERDSPVIFVIRVSCISPNPSSTGFFLFTQMSCQELMGVVIIKENKFAL